MTDNVVDAGISVNDDATLNFGNYLSADKIKVAGFDVNGRDYSVKTHAEVTRLEQNGKLVIECVPGASVWNFLHGEDEISFIAKGAGVTGVTLELLSDTMYEFRQGNNIKGELKTGKSGKASFSAELSEHGVPIVIRKAL